MGILDWLFGGKDEPKVKLSDRIPDTVKIPDRLNLTRGKYKIEMGEVEQVKRGGRR